MDALRYVSELFKLSLICQIS